MENLCCHNMYFFEVKDCFVVCWPLLIPLVIFSGQRHWLNSLTEFHLCLVFPTFLLSLFRVRVFIPYVASCFQTGVARLCCS